MAEFQKALTPVVMPHAAGTNAAKGGILGIRMLCNVIDRHATGVRVVEHIALLSFILSEIVKRQRVIDVLAYFAQL